MKQYFTFVLPSVALVLLFAPFYSPAQQPLSWDDVKAKFAAENSALKADALSVDEAKASEISAALRPNPQYSISADGTQLTPHNGVWQPLAGTQIQNSISYLHERDGKRALRQLSAKESTQISRSQHEDLKRNMLFTLRSAFVQTLEAKYVLKLAKADLDYYDKIIDISNNRLRAGDIAQIDYDRIGLQRVLYESELETAIVDLRTAKIQLLQLLNDHTPVDVFDVDGVFDFADNLQPLDEYRKTALGARPDLQAAILATQQAKTNHDLANANGSVDPTFSVWETHNPSFNNPFDYETLGIGVSIPLHIFDRNQGEKKRTQIDMDRNRQLTDAARAQVFHDVDSSYEVVRSSIALLKPYKNKYNGQAVRVRDTISYAYLHGGASLMDFLSAQSDYRTVELGYAQLIGTYLTAAGQLNLAVGREVLP